MLVQSWVAGLVSSERARKRVHSVGRSGLVLSLSRLRVDGLMSKKGVTGRSVSIRWRLTSIGSGLVRRRSGLSLMAVLGTLERCRSPWKRDGLDWARRLSCLSSMVWRLAV